MTSLIVFCHNLLKVLHVLLLAANFIQFVVSQFGVNCFAINHWCNVAKVSLMQLWNWLVLEWLGNDNHCHQQRCLVCDFDRWVKPLCVCVQQLPAKFLMCHSTVTVNLYYSNFFFKIDKWDPFNNPQKCALLITAIFPVHLPSWLAKNGTWPIMLQSEPGRTCVSGCELCSWVPGP
jgi:hypothetical protein